MPQHLKCLATVLYDLPLITVAVWNCHLFSDITISQGSVVMRLRCGGIFSYQFAANLSPSLTVKGFWNSVKIWQNYRYEFGGLVSFGTQCSFWMLIPPIGGRLPWSSQLLMYGCRCGCAGDRDLVQRQQLIVLEESSGRSWSQWVIVSGWSWCLLLPSLLWHLVGWQEWHPARKKPLLLIPRGFFSRIGGGKWPRRKQLIQVHYLENGR